MIKIQLTQGYVALIDDEDFELVSQYNWRVQKKKSSNYAHAYTGKFRGKDGDIFIHRLIMNAQEGQDVDHINHDGLDNRKENLRVYSRTENQQNKEKHLFINGKKTSSKYKGVNWVVLNKRWRSRIYFNNKRISLGYFLNEKDAARAYDKKAVELFGEFAYLNFPESWT